MALGITLRADDDGDVTLSIGAVDGDGIERPTDYTFSPGGFFKFAEAVALFADALNSQLAQW